MNKIKFKNQSLRTHILKTCIPYCTFKVQERLHISAVIFPTIEGRMYGFSVYQFETLQQRIELGKKLAWLLFHPIYNGSFYKFALQTTHTGSREDYEVYAKETRKSYTPTLREIYPVILHEEIKMRDWFCANMKMNVLFVPEEPKGKLI